MPQVVVQDLVRPSPARRYPSRPCAGALARRAGVSVGTIHRRFEDKEQLITGT
ncbi:helix-turn-helix domain-containing protein [Streptomyces sp. NPDC006487]|uniref:helix-turn-helix domain-containing protein n=1 Tax=Streptomyces sp. NPDC006487 TaxID=3364748 RepID=UPI00368D122D